MKPRSLIFGGLCLFASMAYGATGIDLSLNYFGVYQDTQTTSNNVTQRLEIKKDHEKLTPYEKDIGRMANISIHSIAVNGHTCEYTGTGHWNKLNDRFEFISTPDEYDDTLTCKLVVIIKNNSAYTITQNKECQVFCGMRNSLDGLIVTKIK